MRKYIIFYDRDAMLEALRLSLPVKRTTDLSRHVPLLNAALRVRHVLVSHAQHACGLGDALDPQSRKPGA